jgi:UDP-4-amino-4,6-dideoxy-N-acetyl-beta-L-altrosamine N-acetyltransferase
MLNIETAPIGVLRDIRLDELDMMLEWRNAPNVRRNMYTQHVISNKEHLAWWGRVSADRSQQYLMYEFEGVPVGIVAFNSLDVVSKTASWAFYASPVAISGTGARMEFLAIEHAFKVLNLYKLQCEVFDFNKAVIKLHKKFGFNVEEIFCQHRLVGGKYFDVYRLALLCKDWESIRTKMYSKFTKSLLRSQSS